MSFADIAKFSDAKSRAQSFTENDEGPKDYRSRGGSDFSLQNLYEQKLKHDVIVKKKNSDNQV